MHVPEHQLQLGIILLVVFVPLLVSYPIPGGEMSSPTPALATPTPTATATQHGHGFGHQLDLFLQLGVLAAQAADLVVVGGQSAVDQG